MKQSDLIGLSKVELEVTAWLMLARHYYDHLREVERKLMLALGEEEEYGHISDFVFSGQTDAKSLIKKVESRRKGKP